MPFRIFGPKGHLIVRSATLARVKQLLPALRKRFGRVRVVNLDRPPPTLRQKVVQVARWGVVHEPTIHYAEIRPMPLSRQLPFTTDCSGFVTLCYYVAGAPDPNGLGYNGEGFTGTLLEHGRRIALAEVRPGDLVVYGPGSGVHTALVVEAGPDPLTVSHGQEKGPAFVHVSEDDRQPVRYLSFLP